MTYNKNKSPMATKIKQTIRLSRGLLAFVFIFGLSAALTAEASRKKGRVDTTERTQETKKQATGQRPTRNSHTQGAEKAWAHLGKTFGLNLSDKAFESSFNTLKKQQKESLDSFLSDVVKAVKENGSFKSVVESILSSIGNGGNSNKILLLETVGVAKQIQAQARDTNPKEVNANKRMNAFLDFLKDEVTSSKKEAEGENVLTLAVTRYNKEYPDKKLSLKDLKEKCFGKG